jgi:tight adherence protein B
MSAVVPALAALGVLMVYDGIAYGPTGRKRFPLRRLDGLIREAGWQRLTGGWLLCINAAATLVTFVIVLGTTLSPTVALALALGVALLPMSVLRSRVASRRRRFRDAWPDAIATVIAAVRAGQSLPEACVSLVDRGPIELRSGFRAFTTTYRASASFIAGLERLRDELADPIADRVVAALMLTYEVGGTELIRVLRSLSDFVREDLRVRKEIEARWSWTVTAARTAAAAPWIVLLLMATRPEAAAAYNSGTGAMVIGAGGIATVVGYRLMLRAARLPDERRLVG